jgi:hypothetical protein
VPIEPPDTQEDFHRHVTVSGFDDAHSFHVEANPVSDDFDVFRSDEVGLVENHEVSEPDLTQFQHVELIVIAVTEDTFGIDETGDTVKDEQSLVPTVEERQDYP